jgi:adhesin HecA-like repeat protein
MMVKGKLSEGGRGRLIMRCAVMSRAGQVIANGRLLLHQNDDGEWQLDLQTDGGRLIQGGIVDPNGDLTIASQTLFRGFFEVWGMSDLTLTVTVS